MNPDEPVSLIISLIPSDAYLLSLEQCSSNWWQRLKTLCLVMSSMGPGIWYDRQKTQPRPSGCRLGLQQLETVMHIIYNP